MERTGRARTYNITKRSFARIRNYTQIHTGQRIDDSGLVWCFVCMCVWTSLSEQRVKQKRNARWTKKHTRIGKVSKYTKHTHHLYNTVQYSTNTNTAAPTNTHTNTCTQWIPNEIDCFFPLFARIGLICSCSRFSSANLCTVTILTQQSTFYSRCCLCAFV